MTLNQKWHAQIRILLIMLAILAVGVSGFLVYSLNSDDSSSSSEPLSEADMRAEFRCDRLTREYISTDIYCNDYPRYLEDFINQALVKTIN